MQRFSHKSKAPRSDMTYLLYESGGALACHTYVQFQFKLCQLFSHKSTPLSNLNTSTSK